MKKGKNCIIGSVFLSLTFLSILFFSTASLAASGGWIVNPSGGKEKISKTMTYQVEAGQTFYLCDYARIWVEGEYNYRPPIDTKVKYTSGNPKVAAVKGSYGKVTTKKPGTAVITAIYKNERYTLTLKVKKKGALKTTGSLKNINTAAKKLAACYDPKDRNTKKIKKDFQKILRLVCTYKAEKAKSSVWKKLSKKGNLCVPSFLRCEMFLSQLDDYFYSINDTLKAESVEAAAGSDTVKVTLASPITLEQLVYFQKMAQGYLAYTKKAININETQTTVDSETIGYTFTIQSASGATQKYSSLCTFTVNSREVLVKLYSGKKHVQIIKAGDRVATDGKNDVWKNTVTSPAA